MWGSFSFSKILMNIDKRQATKIMQKQISCQKNQGKEMHHEAKKAFIEIKSIERKGKNWGKKNLLFSLS